MAEVFITVTLKVIKYFLHLNLMSFIALICSWRLVNLNTNQYIHYHICVYLYTRWAPDYLLGVEDLSEDEDQHDVLVVFPQTVQLRLAQLEELRHRLSKIFFCSGSKNISNIFSISLSLSV